MFRASGKKIAFMDKALWFRMVGPAATTTSIVNLQTKFWFNHAPG
jgi:hypothetical protein